jgi:hypothetical protein
MTFSICMLVLAVFLSGAVAGVFIMLAIGIRKADRAHHLTYEPDTHLDALTRSVLGVGIRSAARQEIAAPKETDQCALLLAGATPFR